MCFQKIHCTVKDVQFIVKYGEYCMCAQGLCVIWPI